MTTEGFKQKKFNFFQTQKDFGRQQNVIQGKMCCYDYFLCFCTSALVGKGVTFSFTDITYFMTAAKFDSLFAFHVNVSIYKV